MLAPLALLGLLTSQVQLEPFLRHPDIHGSSIVFISEGDLWVGSLKTGEARRLTSDAGIERFASFSPDGSQIAFDGEYDGQRQAYVMASEGGAPRRLTSVEGFRGVLGWTPDGKSVIVRYLGVPTHYTIATVPATGGVPRKLPLEFAAHVWYGPSADQFAFTRFNRWSHAWFRYVGGMQNQIWVRSQPKRPGGPTFTQITEVDGTNEFPTWCGDRIYFVNEKNAKFTLMSVPSGGGKVRAELPPSDVEIRELSTDGRTLVFESGRTVQAFDPATQKATQVEMRLETDLIHTRPTTVSAESYVQGFSIGATGKRLLVEARGQILTVPAGDGEARVWKATPGTRYRHPSMSPDTKKIAYVSDATGEQQVYIANADGSNATQLTQDSNRQIWGTQFSPDGKWIAFTDSQTNLRIVNAETKEGKTVADIPFQWFKATFSFSPDSKWIAYQTVAPGTLFTVIELYEIATGKVTRVSDGWSNDQFPSFTPDGKYLAFVANRNISTSSDPILNQLNAAPMGLICLLALRADADDPFAPKDPEELKDEKKPEAAKPEFKIDLEGLYQRRIELPIPPAQISALAATQTRILYISDGTLKFYDLAAKAGGDLGPASSFQIAPDNVTIAVPAGPAITVMNEKGEGKKAATFGGLRLRVEPKAEWKQIFWDAWRHLRDYFYVPNMHGVDWKAIGAKYAAMLPSVRSRDEVDELIRWMQAELGSSHEYLQPGDSQDIKTRIPGAYLGCELAEDPSGYFKIAKIYRGDGFLNSERSPLLGLGKPVKEGMFLVEVAGEAVRVGSDPLAGLAGRAGKVVSVKVNDRPALEGAKTLLVKPVASEARMRYLDWVDSNRKSVDKASGGRLGYLHLSAMSIGNMNDFVRQYFSQRDKDGFVVDVRFNSGGFVQDYINRILNASLTGFFNSRDNDLSWTRQQDYFTGPMAVLMNEFNISCGEEFPHRFKDLKRGPLIGRRTMGGEVGSDPGWPMIDGGSVNVPNYGMWTPKDGWVIEGRGVEPDIDVPSDPNAFVEGRDPQISKAVDWLLDELKRKPPLKPKQPLIRDRVNGG